MKLVLDRYLDAGQPERYAVRGFLSILPDYHEGYTAVCREFDSDSSHNRSEIRVLYYNESFDLQSDEMLCEGEDARLFERNGEHWCLMSRHDAPSDDWHIFIVRLADGFHRRVDLGHRGFHGKNWTPVCHDAKLFIRSLEPLSTVGPYGVLLHGTATRDIGAHRGGSNAIACGGIVSGFGHRTDSYDSHIPFYYEIVNGNQLSIQVPELVGLPDDAHLVDPTSYWPGHVAATIAERRWTDNPSLRHTILRIEP